MFDQGQQVGRGGAAVGQPHVQGAFDRGGARRECLQVDHPRAALERVEGTADDRQRILGCRIARQLRQRRGNRRQHFLGLEDEDLQQLCVDGLRRLRCRRLRLRKLRLFRLLPLHGGRLLVAQFLQQGALCIEDETAACAVVVLRQHVGKEAQRADVAGDVVQRRGLRLDVAVAFGQRRHRLAHVPGGARRLGLVEDAQRALHLVQQRRRPFECAALGQRGVIVFVEQLFDLAQAGLDLAGQRGHRLPLLDLARQFVLP